MKLRYLFTSVLMSLALLMPISFSARADDGGGAGDGGGDGGAPDPCIEAHGHYVVTHWSPPRYDQDNNEVMKNTCVIDAPPETVTAVTTNTAVTTSNNIADAPVNQSNALENVSSNYNSASQYHAGVSVLQAAEGLINIDSLGANGAMNSAGPILEQSAANMYEAQNLHDSGAKALAAKDSLGDGKSQSIAPAFQASEKVLRSKEANSIFDEFEKKFSMDRNDFAKKLIGSKGDVGAVAQELKLPADAVEKALAAARDMDAEEKQKVVSQSKTGNLRNALRAKLGDSSSSPDPAPSNGNRVSSGSVYLPKATNTVTRAAASVATQAEFKNLKAEGTEFFGTPQSAPQAAPVELTIFDVVHRKYREKLNYFK